MPSLDLPLPPNALRVNRRLGKHWGSVQAIKHVYELEVVAALLRQDYVLMEPPWPKHIYVTIVLGPGQRVDLVDALTWAKPAWDVLTKERVWPDDSSTYICPITVMVETKDRKNPRIELRW